MKTDIKELVTEVRGAASVSEICGAADSLGEPCMLIVYGGIEADVLFPADVPFITAYAAAEGESVSDSVKAAFDLVIDAGTVEEYTEKLFKDKTKWQINEINKCFIAARKGSQEEVLACESRAFYRLMAAKNGGGINE